ncbi:hypothetical protein NDU88_002158 [Pleurodeles waltl]|uniref:Secreted protein n=1 Tax=Pleurodeles waltl TaxID=8319 RepID=A0AAV7T1M6_PLEWA|nr:hypothetical protein NDU88_002158 [Pleurodeles waltl]
MQLWPSARWVSLLTVAPAGFTRSQMQALRSSVTHGLRQRRLASTQRAHTDLRRYFPRGESCVVFRHADSLFLWIAGSTRCPGSVRGFSCLFSGCASFCGAARQSFDLTAGVASISPGKSGGVVLARPCVKVSISRQASRRFLLGSRAALSLRGRASKFRSSRRRRVDQRRCAAFFLPRNKLCGENFGARSVQVEERSLFGPETSGNRRQALSKPLESTFTARQEFSKAAV